MERVQILLSAPAVVYLDKIYTAMGKLLNVSTNTVVRWEAVTSIPRDAYRPGLAELRTMGIKEVKTLLR